MVISPLIRGLNKMKNIISPLVEVDQSALVDHIGSIDLEIKKLKKQLDANKAILVEQYGNQGHFDGANFCIIAATFDRDTVNWQKIAKKLNASRQLIAGNTTTKEQTRLTIKAI
jgi:hypothetical protein